MHWIAWSPKKSASLRYPIPIAEIRHIFNHDTERNAIMATLQPNQSAVIATFDTHPQAELGVKELQKSGFDMNKLSIIGPGYHSEEHPLGFYIRSDRIKTWGGIGAFWGSLWGILLGAAFFWVPGFGPLAVAGPIVGMLAGGLEGPAVAGGISAILSARWAELR
jgi:hypothetical protein